MALSITSAARLNGAGCDHITVVANVEGRTVTVQTSFSEIDAIVPDTDAELLRMLVFTWAAYRRRVGRAVVGVNIA
jgi:hypothetical protein